ncbi:MAG: NAD(P)-binding domain-containing protein [Verrucomicrobia bacterium]|nr:NAD(P)-binding domain-containing protein [Verrucomicrobiota bacterium]MCF7709241.1 NAD(P)-binding domain-containing protein [Verrucomicrobiota bacterium]
MEKSIGFIGGGRIARIILHGLANAGSLPDNITVSEPDSDTAQQVQGISPSIQIASNGNAEAAARDIVFLAVHPPMVKDVIADVKSGLGAESILISLAPKITMARLGEMLDGFKRLIRVIPNAPSIIGAGFNPAAFSPALEESDRRLVTDLLSHLGTFIETTEDKLEAYAVITAMSPTYFWFQLYELVALGQSFGLSHSEVIAGLEKMLIGSVAVMKNPQLSADEVKDLIPVKPLTEMEPQVTEMYRGKLNALFQKIKP